uniref:MFS transporter n=1 Tax=Herbidospora sakaeratensis TaxID=564415 RepID=UPI00078308A4|nr:MFS transporter [Herbidospora sakaeratensis]
MTGWAPFRHHAFTLLFAGRFVAFLGNAVAPVAVAFAVLDLTGSAGDVGLVLAARSLALGVFVLVGGVWADRLPRNAVLVAANLVSAATQAVAATVVLTGNASVPALIGLEAVNGAAAAFVLPAASGIIPQTLPPTLLQRGNTLLRIGTNAAAVGGASLGGFAVAALGPGWGLAIDAAAFAFAAGIFTLMRVGRAVPEGGEEGAGFAADLRTGWREFAARTWLWVVVAAFCVINAAFAAAFATLGPVVADTSVGRAGWGLVVGAQAAGFLLGGLAALRLRADRPLLTAMAAMLATAPVLFVLGLAPALAPLVALSALAGAAMEVFGVLWDTSVQRNVPQEVLSRVYAYDALGSFVAIPVGQALAGPVSVVFGLGPTVAFCGVLIVGAVAAALAVPGVRRLRL